MKYEYKTKLDPELKNGLNVLQSIQDRFIKQACDDFDKALVDNMINALYNNDVVINDKKELIEFSNTGRIQCIFHDEWKINEFILDLSTHLLYYSNEADFNSYNHEGNALTASFGKIEIIKRKEDF